MEISPLLRPYTFPPLELALETDWDRKLTRLAVTSSSETDHAGRRSSELAALVLPAPAGRDRQIDARRGLAAPGGGGPWRRQVRPLPRVVSIDPGVAGDPASGKLSEF